MSYCINPQCPNPQNSGTPLFCQTCGSQLLLQDIYRVIQPLGGGGFGKTFEVEDCGIPKVLKVLHNNHPKAVELFRQEAEVLSSLNHPGIPRVEADSYFTFRPRNNQQHLHCLVMEKIAGMDLEKYMQQRNSEPISQKAAFRWLKQLIEILHEVHQQEYFHRDIKPSNIMIRENGQLVLIDFGTAREVTQTYLQKLGGQQVTGIISPGYTPLEQVNGKAVQQSDFFALGRTFVYLLTGKQPNNFPEDRNTGDLIWRNSVKISKDLGDFIDYLMKPFPGNRPQNTQDIFNYLNNINEGKHSSGLPKNNQKQNQSTVVSSAPEYEVFLRRFFALALDNIILIIVTGLLGRIFLGNQFLPDQIINSIGGFGWWIGWSSFSITTEIFGIILMIFIGLEARVFDDSSYIVTLIFVLFTTVLNWFYFTRRESSPAKATIGKKIMGIVVTDLNGNLISFGRANTRYFAKTISLITLLIGFIMAAFTKKKQALHDKIAGTLVVKKVLIKN
ncbi:RDD family protein [Okeania sp.]|uniref:protein kinase domain-containing protein n=1 Tax=Okeania sp. TaxID=3100323 RepID=UPI002B4B6592|nr:RDD family protein [Okeania sp.]MEB3339827.1 RDD family protein [Okeania sp.]